MIVHSMLINLDILDVGMEEMFDSKVKIMSNLEKGTIVPSLK